MLNRYYEQELGHLRELAAEFSKAYPALAPMLAGPSSDPDVERLLEGVAFLTGLVRSRVDDDFPEFMQALGNLIFPHYLRPVPACTMIVFEPKGKLNEPALVKAGVEIASVPVDGTPCTFRTCYSVEVHPLSLTRVELIEHAGSPPAIRLSLKLDGVPLANWPIKSLRFFLSDAISSASALYFVLSRYLREIAISSQGGEVKLLPASALRPVGFDSQEELLPYPSHAYPGYRVLQEYFLMPEKFLFFELEGLERWQSRGQGQEFTIEFRLSETPSVMPPIRNESFRLNVTPAVNLFAADAEPILLDHKRPEYRIIPSARWRSRFQIFSVDEVLGHPPGSASPRTYNRFGLFQSDGGGNTGMYEVLMRASATERAFEAYLSIAYPPDQMPVTETLSIRLTCTNGSLPESLHLGDISKATDTSPERVSFQNIRPPTSSFVPLASDSLLARVVSHLSLNYLSIGNAENLRALLHLYVFPGLQEHGPETANRRRIQGIQDLHIAPANRIVRGAMMRGQHLKLRCRGDHFASQGDLFLFGVVLDRFMADYSAINTYSRMELEDTVSGDRYLWTERIGQQPLI
jgi:type VI secretion system protein ImpG